MPRYRYTMIDSEGSIDFDTSSVENWADFKPSLKRSKTYKGLVSSFTNSFAFVGNLRNRVRNLLDKKGTNAEADIFIYAGNENGERNSFTLVGEGQRFTGNFNDIEIDELRAKLNFEDSSFSNKFFARHKEKINYDIGKNLDGDDMSAYTLDEITLHDRTIKFVNKLEFSDTTLSASAGIISITEVESLYVPIPLSVVYRSDDNYKNLPLIGVENDSFDPLLKYYLTSEKDRILNQQITAEFRFSRIVSLRCTYEVVKRIVDENDTILFNLVIDSGTVPNHTDANNHDGWYVSISYSSDDSIHIKEGYSMQFFIRFIIDGEGGTGIIARPFFDGYLTEQSGLNTFIIESNSTEYFPKSTAQCIQPHELFARYTEIITGQQNAFYSDLFGRTDLGYAEDGEWSRLVALNGLMIRKFPFEVTEIEGGKLVTGVFNSSFEEIFKAYNAITPLSLEIEIVGGVPRIRIEKYEDRIGTEVVAELGQDISGLKRKIRQDAIYTSIKCGYKDQEYEEVNGLGSVHGEMNLTTPLKAKDKIYDIMCPWVVGGYDIEFPRRKPFEDYSTEDTRYDSKNYLIDAYLVAGELTSRRDELFSTVTGIFNPQYSYNLRLSPKRNLLRHGIVINECLSKVNGEITYTKGSSNQELVTELLTESSPVVEKDNVVISELPRPLLLAENFMLNAPMDTDSYNLINLNKNKLINFVDISGKKLNGMIEDSKYNHSKQEIEFTLIRANR